MRVLTRHLAALLVAGPLLLQAVPAAAQVFNPETFTLANGLQVVVVPNHRSPVVTHMVWYKVGAADEHTGKTGIAHFLEHLMFKGTTDVPPGEFSKIIARHGGNDNAFTASDYTAYFQNVAKDNLELVMKLEADRMANLRLLPKDVETELQVIIEERRTRIDNEPSALLNERAEAALFLNHPYHNPVIGWPADMAGLTRDDALDWYRKFYAPNNAILIIGGDVTAAEVKPLAEKYYGAVARRDTPPRMRPQEPLPLAARRVVMHHPDVHQPAWSRRYLAPSYHAGETRYAAPLDVLAEVIGGSTSSRLYRDLAVTQGVATSAGADYDPSAFDLATFNISVSPRPGVAMDKLEAATDQVLADIAAGHIADAEIERAKERLIANLAYARDSLKAGAYAFGVALTTGGDIKQVEEWPARIAAVTPEQVREAAEKVLRPEASVTALLLPAGDTAAGAEEEDGRTPSQAAIPAKEPVR